MVESNGLSSERVLAIYAHPDDECYCSGGTLALYAAAGATTKVISATRGEAGEINDVKKANRNTLGRVRGEELAASCAALGVHEHAVWEYPDGGLSDVDPQLVLDDLVYAIRAFRPTIIITFGPDGAYGHPDHVAIGNLTTQAYALASSPEAFPRQLRDGTLTTHQTSRLYHAVFPRNSTLLLEELANWAMEKRDTMQHSQEFAHGLALFAREATMLRYSGDAMETVWYPPGYTIVEQGERGNELYIVLSGTVEIQQSQPDGTLEHLNNLHAGDFFGEMGIARDTRRNAHVIAQDSVTVLRFSPGERTLFGGRGARATLAGFEENDASDGSDAVIENASSATHRLDVREYVQAKISSIAAHRTQTPVTPDMFPQRILENLFGYEYFAQVYPRIQLQTTL